jgi:hypothetical protein
MRKRNSINAVKLSSFEKFVFILVSLFYGENKSHETWYEHHAYRMSLGAHLFKTRQGKTALDAFSHDRAHCHLRENEHRLDMSKKVSFPVCLR